MNYKLQEQFETQNAAGGEELEGPKNFSSLENRPTTDSHSTGGFTNIIAGVFTLLSQLLAILTQR